MRKRFLSLLLIGAMTLGLAACGGNTQSSGASADESSNASGSATNTDTSEPTYGGTATLYFMNLMTDYDPSAPDFENYQFWYERLFGPDWTLTDDTYSYLNEDNLTGQLADSWSWDAENKQLTVTLRDDVTFQKLDDAYDYYGGRNLTADDVKWSYDRLLGIGSGYDEPVFCMQDWSATLYMLDSVETDGDLNVIFNFNTDSDVAVSDFMAAAVNIAGPEWDQLTDDQKSDWHYACGTGPYMISDYVEGSTMKLVKNPNYYAYDERYPENKLPYLDGITLTKIDDNATILSQFIAGKLDFVGNNENVFSVSEATQLRDSMDTSAFKEYVNTITSRNIVLKQTVEPLKDIKVREALEYAINMDEIATKYYGLDDWSIPGLFSSETPFDSTSEWSDEVKDAYYTYDPDKAKSMLEEAGYGDGFTITLTYVDDGDSDLYILIQQYLAAVGVTLDLEPAASQSELQSTVTQENELCGLANAGNVRIGTSLEFWNSSSTDYMLWGDQDKIDGLVQAAENPTSSENQIESIKALDTYIMSQFYLLPISPTQTTSYFVSGKMGGYNGENIYNSWNAGFVMSRVWSTTGE